MEASDSKQKSCLSPFWAAFYGTLASLAVFFVLLIGLYMLLDDGPTGVNEAVHNILGINGGFSESQSDPGPPGSSWRNYTTPSSDCNPYMPDPDC